MTEPWVCCHTAKMMDEAVKDGACPLCLMIELHHKRNIAHRMQVALKKIVDLASTDPLDSAVQIAMAALPPQDRQESSNG
jgi:hypothetical protein